METPTSSIKLTSYNIFVQKQSVILKNEGVVFKGSGSNFIYIAGLWNIYKNKEPILIESSEDDIIKRMDFEIIKKRWKKAKQEFSAMNKSQKHLADFRSGKIAGVLV
jgi:lipopolysaccharide export LptBFGC system permease protein LptF